MKKLPEQLTQKQQEAINNFLSWWVQMWYCIFIVLFCGSLWFFSDTISRLLPKANGEPFEEIGFILGVLYTVIYINLVKKLVYDVLTRKILDKLIK